MSLATIMTADFEVIRADDPQSVTITSAAGVVRGTKTSIVGDLTRTKGDLQAGGYLPSNMVQVEVLKSDFASSPPVIGDRLTASKFSGTTFAVVAVLDPPIGTYWLLTCEAKQNQ